MIKERFLKAKQLMEQKASYYKITWAIPGGAWVYDTSDKCIDWYPFAIINVLNLRDATPRFP